MSPSIRFLQHKCTRLSAKCSHVREAMPPASVPLLLPRAHIPYEPTIILSILMYHSRPTSTSSSNFQEFFNNALKAYERRTKKDLLAHPLATQLQSCNSPSSILNVLQQQVQELNQPQSSDERLTKWLDPTVKVLYTFSGTLGEGVSLVCPVISKCPRFAFLYLLFRYSRPRKRSLPESVSFF
jgi:hypothetical protein